MKGLGGAVEGGGKGWEGGGEGVEGLKDGVAVTGRIEILTSRDLRGGRGHMFHTLSGGMYWITDILV